MVHDLHGIRRWATTYLLLLLGLTFFSFCGWSIPAARGQRRRPKQQSEKKGCKAEEHHAVANAPPLPERPCEGHSADDRASTLGQCLEGHCHAVHRRPHLRGGGIVDAGNVGSAHLTKGRIDDHVDANEGNPARHPGQQDEEGGGHAGTGHRGVAVAQPLCYDRHQAHHEQPGPNSRARQYRAQLALRQRQAAELAGGDGPQRHCLEEGEVD
mmetsp:Transcript_64399/g.199450  ORF Transcript_64399/g.199450 Transcript_64399/m.199450 type:complete len:212 (+) Transcript_64399:485-1120(+)